VDPTKNVVVSRRRSVERVIINFNSHSLNITLQSKTGRLKIGISNATVTKNIFCVYFFNAQHNTYTLLTHNLPFHTTCPFIQLVLSYNLSFHTTNVMQHMLLNKRFYSCHGPLMPIIVQIMRTKDKLLHMLWAKCCSPIWTNQSARRKYFVACYTDVAGMSKNLRATAATLGNLVLFFRLPLMWTDNIKSFEFEYKKDHIVSTQ
jgi:hypothetical protein